MKKQAAKEFRCAMKFVQEFERQDPFNHDSVVKGYICRKKGSMGGSLFITHVNNIRVDPPQLIYGTPKLSYPYKQTSGREFIDLVGYQYYLSEKWNGMNVLFFFYKDHTGKQRLSAKSKGAPFLSDGEFGKFLSLTKKAFGRTQTQVSVLKALGKRGVVSVSCELCGQEEPHLVSYSFDIDLKPLFMIYDDGRIRPVIDDLTQVRRGGCNEVQEACRQSQRRDRDTNVQFRKSRGLIRRYEFDHFATEGKVLYLMDSDGFVINRTIYKVKPVDVEKCHWAVFDAMMEGRVKEALTKIRLNEEPITESSLREELDMGPKEWSKFRRGVLKFCAENLQIKVGEG